MDGRVLIVDDDDDMRDLITSALRRRGLSTVDAPSAARALDYLNTEDDLDAVVTDLQLGGMTGLELCQRVAERRPDVPVLVITAYGSMDTAIAAIRAGAYDFIPKPISTDALLISLERAVRHHRLASEVRRLRAAVARPARLSAIVGDSPAVQRVTDLIDQVSDSDASVLITGESGTGKELVARALHDRGTRADKQFVAVNCAAMPASLLESELFGHVKGAFTDARRDRPGLFVQAAGGTIFLDEIGEMPLEMQVKLLRSLQERKVRPVGGDEEVSFSARIVSATNRDLPHEVEEGRFRADLFYRINVVHVEVPPLRSRAGDVLVLAQHFLRRHADRNGKPVLGISASAAQKLSDYSWPGNVRELENAMERAVALTRLTELAVDDLPEVVRDYQATRLVLGGDDPDELLTLDEVERRYIRRVLAVCNGNKSQAARVLGMDRRSLYRRLETLDAEPKGRDGGNGSARAGGPE